jgi:dTDP-4-dehydrorhamnose 3,5-epimerase
MIFTETKLKGVYIIDVKRIGDERGFFGRAFCQNEFLEYGLTVNMVQTNLSFSKTKGTLRGMHMQLLPYGESKLVRCTRGAIFDVAVDLRPDSETFTQWIGVELTADNYRMLYSPEGFAHGFITLKNDTDVTYPVSQFYTPAAERGFRWNDPTFKIQWPIEPVVVSDKDKSHPLFDRQNWQVCMPG